MSQGRIAPTSRGTLTRVCHSGACALPCAHLAWYAHARVPLLACALPSRSARSGRRAPSDTPIGRRRRTLPVGTLRRTLRSARAVGHSPSAGSVRPSPRFAKRAFRPPRCEAEIRRFRPFCSRSISGDSRPRNAPMNRIWFLLPTFLRKKVATKKKNSNFRILI